MYYLRTFSMAMKSIFANKMRSFLTMLGIIIGVSSVITLVTLIEGSNKKQMESWYSTGKNTISISYWKDNVDLTDEIYDFCKSMPEYISGITPSKQAWGCVIKHNAKSIDDCNVYYGNDSFSTCLNYTLDMGRDISYSDVSGRTRIAIIGERVKNELFGYENPIGKSIKIKGIDFKVVGTYKAKSNGEKWSSDDMVVVPYTNMRKLENTAKITQFVAKARDAETTTVAVEKIKEFMTPYFSQEYDYSVYTENAWIEEMNESQKMLSLIVGGIAGISLLVGGIGIMNIMLVSVSERTREIGIRTAIGAHRRDIIFQFLIEAATISTLGGIFGIMLGTLAAAVASAALIKTVALPSTFIVIGASLFSLVIGVFFGFYPANKASKLQPIEALRNE